MSLCKSCAATITWARTPSGRLIPLDPPGFSEGNVTLAPGPRGQLIATVHPSPVAGGRNTHFTTCPHAAEHRRDRS